MSTPQQWFSSAIADGMQRLASISLYGCPEGQALELACAVWIDSLWNLRQWSEQQDRERIAQAFSRLVATARRWPAPVQLLDHLPPKKQAPALPAPSGRRVGQGHLLAMRAILRMVEQNHLERN